MAGSGAAAGAYIFVGRSRKQCWMWKRRKQSCHFSEQGMQEADTLNGIGMVSECKTMRQENQDILTRQYQDLKKKNYHISKKI